MAEVEALAKEKRPDCWACCKGFEAGLDEEVGGAAVPLFATAALFVPWPFELNMNEAGAGGGANAEKLFAAVANAGAGSWVWT